MTFTPSALANAFTHTHTPSTFGTTFGTNNEAQHMQCSTLFRESDLETRLQVGQLCVCDGANRLGARVCATRCRILLPGVSVTSSRSVRASAAWDDKRHGSLTEGRNGSLTEGRNKIRR